MTSGNSLSQEAINILNLAARGKDDNAGFINTYHLYAGDTFVGDPDEEDYPNQEIEQAVDELVNQGLATRTTPSHLEGRIGANLTPEGWQRAEQID